MKLIALLLLTALISTPILAFKPHIAHYQLSIDGFKIAEETRMLKQLKKDYLYTANAETSGLVSLFKNYTIAASSTFNINRYGIDGVNYKIIEYDNKKLSKNRTININSNLGIVTSVPTKMQPKKITWQAEKGNIIDPLNIFLALSFELKNNPRQFWFSYQIADGKSIKKKEFKRVRNQDISLQGKTYNAIKIERVNHQGNAIQAYFLAEFDYLPVLIKQTEKGKQYVYEMIDFKPL